jgi:transposase
MARFYKPVDRDQEFLLPVNMRDWLADDHLALFVVELVATLDLGGLHAQYRRGAQGRAAYDPEMLLAVWVYATCVGVRSSRAIESRCRADVAFRFICANRVPDHTTLARFRQSCDSIVEDLFCQLLAICQEAGLVSLGVVAIDGTKVAANAALSANRGEDTIRAEVRKLLDAAAETDGAEDRRLGDARGDELPAGLNRAGRERLGRLRAAAAKVKARKATGHVDADTKAEAARAANASAVEATGKHRAGRKTRGADPVGRAAADLAEARAAEQRAKEALRDARIAARSAGSEPPTRGPVRLAAQRRRYAEWRLAKLVAAASQGRLRLPDKPQPPRANISDPDSAILPTAKGWVQGYNVQAAVNEHQVIIAVHVCDTPSDVGQLEPMIEAATTNLARAGITDHPEVILADAGYWSEANATGANATGADANDTGGHRPERLIATTKSYKLRRQARELGQTHGPPPHGASTLQAMEHRLRSPEGTALYARRSVTVEPVFGQIKDRHNFRRFLRRGKQAAGAEATLVAITHNLLKLFTAGVPMTTPA